MIFVGPLVFLGKSPFGPWSGGKVTKKTYMYGRSKARPDRCAGLVKAVVRFFAFALFRFGPRTPKLLFFIFLGKKCFIYLFFLFFKKFYKK
jgi:hypothetical protein